MKKLAQASALHRMNSQIAPIRLNERKDLGGRVSKIGFNSSVDHPKANLFVAHLYSHDQGKEQAAIEYEKGSRDCSLGWVSVLNIHIFPWQDTELKMRVGDNGRRRRPLDRDFLVGWILADVFQ